MHAEVLLEFQSKFHSADSLQKLGHHWIAAWNARDLEGVLKLYSEDCEMTSAKIPYFGFDASGVVRGKDALRAYWSKALSMLPDLHFDLNDVYTSPNSVVVHYTNERGGKVCEYLRVNSDGLIVQGSGNYTH